MSILRARKLALSRVLVHTSEPPLFYLDRSILGGLSRTGDGSGKLPSGRNYPTIASKAPRQALLEHSTGAMRATDQEKFANLFSWAISNGATLHPSIEVYHDGITKFSLRVKPDSPAIEPSATILSCPPTLSLSYLNSQHNSPLRARTGSDTASSAANEPAFPPQFMDLIEPHVIGRFFLIQQYLLGERSFWYPYIATLQQPEHISSWSLPAFWPDEDIALLTGTNLDGAAEATRKHARREYKAAHRLLREADFEGWQDYSKVLYRWAICMFTSRSFRTALVLPKESLDGLPNAQTADADANKWSIGDWSVNDFSVLMPVFDIANHHVLARTEWRFTQADAGVGGAGVTMTVQQRYQAGAQVYNSYGFKTNSELLLGYGFIIPKSVDSHNDYVNLQLKPRTQADEEDGVPDDAQESAPAGDDNDPTSSSKGRRYLISLHPILHPSSIVGRFRSRKFIEADLQLPPRFGHIEPQLLLDLALKAASPEQVDAMQRYPAEASTPEADMLKNLLAAEEGDELYRLQEDIAGVLENKLQHELDKIVTSRPETEDPKELTPNQRLALRYRRRCGEVLENALGALKTGIGMMKPYDPNGIS
jgi:protein-histidine N-methyltransferase